MITLTCEICGDPVYVKGGHTCAEAEPEEQEEDYSGDDPFRPCRDSGQPSLEQILEWQKLR